MLGIWRYRPNGSRSAVSPQPLDLPDIVAANAQTKICFGLPDATVAAMAARKLEPDNASLPEQIRTLGVGEACVSLGGEAPRLLRMARRITTPSSWACLPCGTRNAAWPAARVAAADHHVL